MLTTNARSLGLSSLATIARMTAGPTAVAAIEEATGATTKAIRIAQITVKPQDRHDFSDVLEFAQRLKIVGHVHTAILVRELLDGGYELIAGERRVRASKLNEWTEIQAKVFPPETPDFVIRLYQVSENVDRKPLTAKETAMGLASDIELYGREQAAKLWTNPNNGKQRSESWISKHLRFKDYGPVTLELFEMGLFGDIEAANKMADIEAASASVAAVIATQMKKGEKLGRGALDLRLTELKNAAKAEQGAERPSPLTGAGPARSPATSTGQSESLTGVAQAADADPAQGAQNVTGLNTTPVSAQHSTGAHETGRETAQLNGKGKTRTGTKDKAEQIAASAEEIFVTSTSAIHSLRQLRADLAAADTGEDETSWRLWVAFASTACASMVGVGDERAEKMLQRLVQELNSKSALELLNTLHPSRKAGILPDDFRYDTKRETFPRAPNNWAL